MKVSPRLATASRSEDLDSRGTAFEKLRKLATDERAPGLEGPAGGNKRDVSRASVLLRIFQVPTIKLGMYVAENLPKTVRAATELRCDPLLSEPLVFRVVFEQIAARFCSRDRYCRREIRTCETGAICNMLDFAFRQNHAT